jgi:hypothetical protein
MSEETKQKISNYLIKSLGIKEKRANIVFGRNEIEMPL